MQIVEVIDGNGKKMRYGINKDDDPAEAAEIGIPVGVPDMDKIDWNAVKIELNNQLYDAGLFTRDDLASVSGDKFNNIILMVFRKRLQLLYKE